MKNGVVVPYLCRVHRVNDLIHGLKGPYIWVGPRELRICDVFEDRPNEFIAEVMMEVFWEFLDPWENLHTINEFRECEHGDLILLELDYSI